LDVKNQVSYKSHQLIQFIEHLKAVVDEQGQEVKRAVIGWGKYCFKEQYSSPQISKQKWTSCLTVTYNNPQTY